MRVADEEVDGGRDGEIDQDLDQRVDLVLPPDGPDLEEGEAAVHGEHEDRPHQHEEKIAANRLVAHHAPPDGDVLRVAYV